MTFLRTLAVVAALAIPLTIPARAADTTNGTWSIVQQDGNAQFGLRWSDGHGSSDQMSSTDAGGLGIAQGLASSGQHVVFHIEREAGHYTLDGWVGNGKGAGTFTFVPNAAFFDGLRSRGYDVDSIGNEIAAANLDVTTAYVDGIESQGFHGDFGQLMAMRAVGVTPAYVEDMRKSGMSTITARDVVFLRTLGVDGAYIRDLAAVGFSHLDADQYLKLKSLDVDAAYVRYLQSHGLRNLTVGHILAMKAEQI